MVLCAVQFLSVVLLADCASPAVAERDVLLNEAERLGIALSEDELRTQSSVSEEVLSALGEDGAVLRENLRKDLLAEKMRLRMRCAIAERIPQISSEDIAREQAAVAKHNAGLAEANRSICRLATNAWKSIRAGNDFATVGNKLTEMNTGASYEALCEDAATVCTNLADVEMSAPLLEDSVLSFYSVSSPTAGVRRISRIAFQLQKPRVVLSNEQTEMSLVERMIDAAYEKWLNSKDSAPSRTTAERSSR